MQNQKKKKKKMERKVIVDFLFLVDIMMLTLIKTS